MKVESESGQQASVTFAVSAKRDIPSMDLFGLYVPGVWRSITRKFLGRSKNVWRKKNE